MNALMENDDFLSGELPAWQVIGDLVQRCEWMEAQLEADEDGRA
jgi:hypothetical protein